MTSTFVHVKTYFSIKKIKVDENSYNICELARMALEKEGIKSELKLDDKEKYFLEVPKLNFIWRP